jgi:hypothetical protein
MSSVTTPAAACSVVCSRHHPGGSWRRVCRDGASLPQR